MNVLNAEERHAYAKAAFREAKKHDMGPTDTATIEGGAGLVMVVMKQNGEDVVYILTKAEATRSGLPKPSEMN